MWLLVFSFVLFVTFFLVSFNLIIIRLAEPNQNKPKSKARNANDNRKWDRERTITLNRIFLFMSYFIVISCSSNIPFDPHEFQMHVCGLIPEPIRWYVAAPILRKSPRLPLPQSIQLSSSPSSRIIIISPWFICRRLCLLSLACTVHTIECHLQYFQFRPIQFVCTLWLWKCQCLFLNFEWRFIVSFHP